MAARAAADVKAALPAVLFDFDGTFGDTETPALEVSYWELAPYLVGEKSEIMTDDAMRAFSRANAGKPFEFMVEQCDADRAAAGPCSVEECRAQAQECPSALSVVDDKRSGRFGLPPVAKTRSFSVDIVTLQKAETVEALRTMASPCPLVPETLSVLRALGVPVAIATTSGKPRVSVSVVSCGFTEHFPPEKIHSGESDFDPPRFKPDPAVYRLAAKSEGKEPSKCIAVEDSVSGVGSSATAGIGLIVGYVGGSHIPGELKEAHAKALLAGGKSDDGRGADIVIERFDDFVPLYQHFAENIGTSAAKPLVPPAPKLAGQYWV